MVVNFDFNWTLILNLLLRKTAVAFSLKEGTKKEIKERIKSSAS